MDLFSFLLASFSLALAHSYLFAFGVSFCPFFSVIKNSLLKPLLPLPACLLGLLVPFVHIVLLAVVIVVAFALSLDGIFSYRQSLKDLVAKANARRALALTNTKPFSFSVRRQNQIRISHSFSLLVQLGPFSSVSFFLTSFNGEACMCVCTCQKDRCAKSPIHLLSPDMLYTCGIKKKKRYPIINVCLLTCLLAGYA